MNFEKNDIEYLLLHKNFSELSATEKAMISDEIDSEVTYQQMRMFLLNQFETEKDSNDLLIPNPAIKSKLMQEFNQSRNKSIWYNKMAVVLFPKEKPVWQQAGIQVLALAACLVLVLNLLPKDRDLLVKAEPEGYKLEEHGLGQNEPENDKKENLSEIPISGNLEEETGAEVLVAESFTNQNISSPEEVRTNYSVDHGYAVADVVELNEDLVSESSDGELLISAEMPATVHAASRAVSRPASDDDNLMIAANQLPVVSRSLAKDKALIDLLYTAM